MYHTTWKANPAQLVFGRDIILNNTLIWNWEDIRKRKQDIIDKNTQNENKISNPHSNGIHDKVLVRDKKAKKYEDPQKGLYPITKFWPNRIVIMSQGIIRERMNVRWIKP